MCNNPYADFYSKFVNNLTPTLSELSRSSGSLIESLNLSDEDDSSNTSIDLSPVIAKMKDCELSENKNLIEWYNYLQENKDEDSSEFEFESESENEIKPCGCFYFIKQLYCANKCNVSICSGCYGPYTSKLDFCFRCNNFLCIRCILKKEKKLMEIDDLTDNEEFKKIYCKSCKIKIFNLL